MVLWNNGEGLRGGFKKMRTTGKEGAGEASNLMRRPVQRGSRDATTSACVGWDFSNIENRPALRKEAQRCRCRWPPWSKRLHHHQDYDPDHENRRYLIDYTVEFMTTQIAIGGEILDATGKKTVDARQDQHQQKLAMQPAR